MKPLTFQVFSISAASLLCVHPLMSLIGIFYSCCSATNEYKNIAPAIHKLSCASVDDVLLTHLQSFSLQLMTTKMQFTARGFFEITNSTLRQVKIINLQIVLYSAASWRSWFLLCRFCQRSRRTFWLWFSLCRNGIFFHWIMKWIRTLHKAMATTWIKIENLRIKVVKLFNRLFFLENKNWCWSLFKFWLTT